MSFLLQMQGREFLFQITVWLYNFINNGGDLCRNSFHLHREKMPEFMPRPDILSRDRILEKLERQDMYRRREVINIPEFFVGVYFSSFEIIFV